MMLDSRTDEWAVDVRRLVEQAPGVALTTYFDRHEQASLQTAVTAWPFLAGLLGLGVSGMLESPEEPAAVTGSPTAAPPGP